MENVLLISCLKYFTRTPLNMQICFERSNTMLFLMYSDCMLDLKKTSYPEASLRGEWSWLIPHSPLNVPCINTISPPPYCFHPFVKMHAVKQDGRHSFFFPIQAAEYNIFEGLECRGGPALVMSQGRIVYEGGKLQAQQGTGRFLPRKPFPDYAYQRVKCRNQVKYRVLKWIAFIIHWLYLKHCKYGITSPFKMF